MKLRTVLAIICARLAHTAICFFHLGNGASLPGALARRIDPDILSTLAPMIKEKRIVVTGTNGKTTTTRFLCQALRAEGKTVLSNETGANLLNGIVSAFVLNARPGRSLPDYACIEVDELAARRIFPLLFPDCIVLTNIFRDQLDRFGEVEQTCEELQKAASQVPHAVLVANCDDALAAAVLAECPNPSVTYGIPEPVFQRAHQPLNREGVFCPFCGERLHYDFFQYGQLGVYRCPACAWQRPTPDYILSQVQAHNGQYRFRLGRRRHTVPACAALLAPYNLYNILAAYAALQALKAPSARFTALAGRFDFTNRREETFHINQARVQLHLAKNPIGFQQKLALLQADPRPKDLILVINDAPPDGRDISWLWDVDFQLLADSHLLSLVSAGSRRLDMALRLKYENIPCETTTQIRSSLRRLTTQGTKNLYILVNYSGLKPIHQMLRAWQSRQTKKKGVSL